MMGRFPLVHLLVVCLLFTFLVFGQEEECSPPEENKPEENKPEENKPETAEDLFAAARKRQQAMELPRAVEQKKYGTMILLLERGDDVNNVDQHGKSSAYYLAKYGEIEFLHHLHQKGADLHKATPSGSTPLMVAVSTDSFSTACYLLGNEADHLATNNEGKMAVDFAEENSLLGCLLGKVEEAKKLEAHPCHRYFQSQCNMAINLAKSNQAREEAARSEKMELSEVGLDALALQEDYKTKFSLNVMSYNIMYNNMDWRGGSKWVVRKPKSINMIRFHDVDILGLQEVLADQQDDLVALLPEYSSIGVAREDGKRKGEFNPIFYKKSKFSLVKSGTFWLSNTPLVVGSSGWDAHLPRIVTWARLRTKEEWGGDQTGRDILFFNTHFDHGGPESRIQSSQLLLSVLRYVLSGGEEGVGDFEGVNKDFYEQFLEGGEGRPEVFVCGDLNDVSGSRAFKILVGEDNTPTEKGEGEQRGEEEGEGEGEEEEGEVFFEG